MRVFWTFIFLAAIFLAVFLSGALMGRQIASAHEVRPGYIEITETASQEYRISWKQPARERGSQLTGLGLRPVFPPNCERLAASQFTHRPGALIEQFSLKCAGGLAGQLVGVEGLQKTITDIFVRFEPLEGRQLSVRLTAEHPAQKIAGGGVAVLAYFNLGLKHFLTGFDHILFVIGLMVLVPYWRQLFWVITSFTIAHSLTLALSVLDLFRLSSAPVEAAIALSILFVAIELTRPPERRSPLAVRFPQVIAFGFGLLHGFGFAGVLYEIGLPQRATLEALALFNIGIEAGQIMLVVVLFTMGAVYMRFFPRLSTHMTRAWTGGVPLLMGAMACYWLISRIGGFGG